MLTINLFIIIPLALYTAYALAVWRPQGMAQAYAGQAIEQQRASTVPLKRKWTGLILLILTTHALVILWMLTAGGVAGARHLSSSKGALLFISFVMAGGLTHNLLRTRQMNLLLLFLPVVLMLLGVALALPTVEPAVTAIHDLRMLTAHILVFHAGIALLFLAFLVGLLLIVQNRALKKKQIGPVSSFIPSINLLDTFLARLVIIGFALFTIGLTIGMTLAHTNWLESWRGNPRVMFKVFFTGFDWLWFGLLLQMRLVRGWRGKRLAILTIIGFAVVAFTFVGINLFHQVNVP